MEKQIGVVLVAVGIILLLSALFGTGFGWIWVAAVSAAFFVGYSSRREPGLLVPAGILAGVALGIFLEGFLNNVFLFGLAGGFAVIGILEPKVHSWAFWPAAILVGIATLTIVGTNPVLFAALLLVAGLIFLFRSRSNS